MRIPYTQRQTSKPIFSLGNVIFRFRPLLTVKIVGPSGRSQFYQATLDSGADDTVFPSSVADDLGIDLANAQEHECDAVGGHRVHYRYAETEFQLSDGNEMFVWNAIVGFGEAIKRGILGYAGMMQYFDIEFLGESRQVIIEPNPSFTGQRHVRKAP